MLSGKSSIYLQADQQLLGPMWRMPMCAVQCRVRTQWMGVTTCTTSCVTRHALAFRTYSMLSSSRVLQVGQWGVFARARCAPPEVFKQICGFLGRGSGAGSGACHNTMGHRRIYQNVYTHITTQYIQHRQALQSIHPVDLAELTYSARLHKRKPEGGCTAGVSLLVLLASVLCKL